MGKKNKKLFIAQPRGFCAGVDRAIDIVHLALELYGTPLYVKHAIVHNTHVVKEFESRGVIFVDQVKEIPKGATVVFSAHGSTPQEFEEARNNAIRVLDATCPLVTKVHLEVKRFSRLGYDIIMVGHKGHVEPVGTLGNANRNSRTYLVEKQSDAETLEPVQSEKLAVVTQTTLSVDETRGVLDTLRRRFPDALFPHKEDICYATTNRQEAVKKMLPNIDVLCVVGSATSSNSNRLKDLGTRYGISSYLVDDSSCIDSQWFTNAESVGVTSGASVPEHLLNGVVAKLEQLGFMDKHAVHSSVEDVHFSLPHELISQSKQHNRGKQIIEKHKITPGKQMRV